ncbi:hypothetical protein BT63DRAFT_370661 [Microthyrium microscopicum]|uniref:Zn(2)-C6 fungal-type domain-containing protein n=1 Tax=Microthyrium microscopicum TaxID=703497 RepID=A0A6A6UGN6_9PEZI|nr:hypothetical protein BT63DRAFT_370661 [Microthyrium microscopicum]
MIHRNGSASKACHNCRQNRRKCDRSVPTCNKCHSTRQECLGYGKLLQWTNSVATRGKMMGKNFSAAGTSQSIGGPGFIKISKQSQAFLSSTLRSSWCLQPSDPPFSDLSKTSRFYLSYYDSQVCKDLVLQDVHEHNPFRDLLSLTGDYLVLREIIIANSALHFANVTKKGTLKCNIGSASPSEAYKDALVAKQQALRLLSDALSSGDFRNSAIILASMMLFIKFELLDSGRNGWRFHTEGARQLMVYLRDNGKPDLPALYNLKHILISNCTIYDILGTTLTASALTRSSDIALLNIASKDIDEDMANGCLSCPPLLLQVIRDVSRFSQSTSESNMIENNAIQLLSVVDAFNPYAWASSLQKISTSFDLDKRAHIGCAYKEAVKIYIIRATSAANSPAIHSDSLEDLVSEIILHLTPVPPEDSFFKATCWPSFMAGAETNDPAQRKWVLSRLETGLNTLPWGFLSSAVDLLPLVWDYKSQYEPGPDWLIHLKLSDNDWLIA